MDEIYKTELKNLKKIKSGKVRELYDLGDELLLVATDRISAFDVVMNEVVPEKGQILTQISKYWFERTKHIIDNHIVNADDSEFPEDVKEYYHILHRRSLVVKKASTLPVEFIVRGYITGSGWKSYKKSGEINGIKLPEGLKEFQQLPEPIFTPTTKAEEGHDEPITFDECANIIGEERANKLKDISIKLYEFAHKHLNEQGIILADTKFEFGETENGEIILIDEVLTPDSSRFWLKENYEPGKKQVQFDKQILRDYLETVNWNKMPPPPSIPKEILYKTADSYKTAFKRITGKKWI